MIARRPQRVAGGAGFDATLSIGGVCPAEWHVPLTLASTLDRSAPLPRRLSRLPFGTIKTPRHTPMFSRNEEAVAHLRRVFEKAPSLELYQRLCKAGDTTARDQALESLKSRLAREKPSAWHYPADLIISIQIREKQFDMAWARMREYGASAGLKEQLARASEATHPREALKMYAERVDQLAKVGGDGADRSRNRFGRRCHALANSGALASRSGMNAAILILRSGLIRKAG